MSVADPRSLSPFDGHYGFVVGCCTPELARGRLCIEERHLDADGLMHGGVFAAMAEALASMGTNTGVVEQGMIALGQSNSCTFLQPISEGSVEAVARRVHAGPRTWVWGVELFDQEECLAAIAQMVIAVRPLPPEAGR